MKGSVFGTLACAGCLAVGLPSSGATRATASYTLIAESLDSGGAAFSASYANRSTLEPVVGYSAATIPDSTARFIYHGFIPQLDAPLFAVADVAVTMTASPVLSSPQELVTYSGTVANLGTEAAAGVLLTVTLPTNVVFNGVNLSQGSAILSANILRCDLGTVPGGGAVNYSIQLTPTSNGVALVNATVAAEAVDLLPANNSASAQSTVVTAVRFTLPGGGAWYNAANWTPAVVPTTNHKAIIDGDIVDFYTADATVAGLVLTGGRIGGAHRLTVTTLAEWSGGELQSGLSLVIAPGATLRVTNGYAVNLRGGSGIENHGAIRLESTALQSAFGAWVTNRGVIEFVGNPALLRFQDSGFIFHNLPGAVVRKSAGTGMSSIPVSFLNDGLVEVLAGAMDFNGAFVNGGYSLVNRGTLRAAAGTEIRYTKANSFEHGSAFEGPGSHRIIAATMGPGDGSRFLGAIGGDFEIANGRISGTFTNTGHLLWTGGNLQAIGPNTLTIPAGSQLTLAGGGARSLVFGFGIQNLGTVRLAGASLNHSGGGSVDNLGLFDLAGDFALSSGLIFTNRAGSNFRKSAGTGTSTIDLSLFRNEGVLDLRSGTFALIGGYTPTATASLNIYLSGTAPGAQFSRLTATGPAALNGALNVILTEGFTPAAGNTFTILTAPSRTGTFANFRADPAGNGWALSPVYLPTGVTLQLVPGPALIDLSSTQFGSGQFQFNFQGAAGATYVIQATPVLGPAAGWVPIATNVASGDLMPFVDPAVAGFPTRFYRAVLQP